jgi:DNA invertase Pin-like site-specific DNA recombinase
MEVLMNYAYIRVSTVDQNEARQLEAMKKFDIPAENYFIEKVSGKDTNRPQLMKLLSMVKRGDTIHIHDFSRLSRSTSDLLRLVETLNDKGVTLISNKENLDTSTPTGKLMLTMIGAINEFERTNLLERQREGMQIAKQNGVFKKKDIDPDLFNELKEKVTKGQVSVVEASKQLGVSRQTWYKLIAKDKADA